MYNAFIRSGHGYEISDRGRCEAFDGFDIIASPLGDFDNASRESRIFRRASGNGTDYGSHSIKLARMAGTFVTKDLFILMHNGSGREVLQVPEFYDGGDLAETIIALPERVQYALLYSIWKTATSAKYEAQSKTGQRWAQAYVDKKIRKRKGRVEIVE